MNGFIKLAAVWFSVFTAQNAKMPQIYYDFIDWNEGTKY